MYHTDCWARQTDFDVIEYNNGILTEYKIGKDMINRNYIYSYVTIKKDGESQTSVGKAASTFGQINNCFEIRKGNGFCVYSFFFLNNCFDNISL
uniref:Uncharacterized protein n=1 Tax=Lepeophtheirus salmonis TaxID=72036 RepID=A0A0K2V964_LEPSM